jgi:hypothetical protein
MTSNILNYSIAREWLEGTVGGEKFSMYAWSGGRRGSKKAGVAEHTFESYNVFRKEQKGVNGGPLPPGLYICHHATDGPGGESIRLEPTVAAMFQVGADAKVLFYNRSGFYIHGRGPIGSQGCIVPENDAERLRLTKAIKKCPDTVLLKVSELGMPLPAAIEKGTMTA